MVSISCSTKFHAFALAEQMSRHKHLDKLFTTYAYQKNSLARNFVRRIDKEEIEADKISTNLLYAFSIKLFPSKVHIWNDLFDKWVASRLKRSQSKVFIGWSSMSLHSLYAAKKKRMVTILERGSSHISFQNEILREEYEKFNKDFAIHPEVIAKELKEYEVADYISVPSYFVRDSFIDKGVSREKLIVNPYGASMHFSIAEPTVNKEKFVILYLGKVSIRKGLVYLFEALNSLNIPKDKFEVWFLGSVDKEMEHVLKQNLQDNWRLFGHINHYELKNYLSQCDVGIHPSLEEGLSMVIPQMLLSGIPVIATTNTGAANIIENEKNGYIVAIRDKNAIAERIELLYNDRHKLAELKANAVNIGESQFTWDNYGKRYSDFIETLL